MRLRLAWTAAALLAAACSEEAPDPRANTAAQPDYRPVIEKKLGEWAPYGLPDPDERKVREVRELLDAATLTGRVAQGAARSLDQMEPALLAAALIEIVEGRDFSDPLRPAAYARLRGMALPATLPRLVLRLKYEKDWTANVDLAATMLALGYGSGLDALIVILKEEGADWAEEARRSAAQVLAQLPPQEGWNPGADWEADWGRLIEVERRWALYRKLADDRPPDTDLPPPLRAEVWRMIAKLESQPLRPVDDARYVLSRLDGRIVPELCAALEDEDHYVREHVLQTLAWMGPCVGHWARRTGYDYLERLQRAMGDPRQRARVLETLGASGMPEAAALVLPWLGEGDIEEITAAADALLRCAGPRHLVELQAFEGDAIEWSPEARYSYALLMAEISDRPPPDPPAELDSAEKVRRDRWLALRRQNESATAPR